jgi:nucleotidyltransferase substrate binding protein (TIGR01987 family)
MTAADFDLHRSWIRRQVAALNGVWAKSNDAELMRWLDEITQKAIKSGVIQHFEFTYDLCWKFSRTAADGVTRRELFRLAAENRLIVDVDEWMRHHDARNLTSHTYDPAVAETIYAAAHDFARDAQRLLEALEARND